VLIENLWSKKRILEVYLNVIEWGKGVYGCEAASRYYFNHSAESLSPVEAAWLAAILPSPRRWSIRRPQNHVVNRHARILNSMTRVRIPRLG
jgi:monofunctional biosynthetic peptidoglycan transglycosylase